MNYGKRVRDLIVTWHILLSTISFVLLHHYSYSSQCIFVRAYYFAVPGKQLLYVVGKAICARDRYDHIWWGSLFLISVLKRFILQSREDIPLRLSNLLVSIDTLAAPVRL